MPPQQTIGGERNQVFSSSIWLYICPLSVRSVHPLTPISCVMTSLYLVERFLWNLTQIFITRVATADKVFKVRGQRSRSWQNEMHSSCTWIPINLRPSIRYLYSRDIPVNGVASRPNCIVFRHCVQILLLT